MSTPAAAPRTRIVFDDKTVWHFVIAACLWGLVGMLVGLLAALQLSVPTLTDGVAWLSFGRVRPLHTNAVIFALVGNMMFAGIYYSTQRLLKARMASDLLSHIHLWGWQLIIVGAAVTLPLGITQSKEYAELEWFLDLLVALVWVAFAVNFFWTLKVRNEPNLYVALWFYIATIVTIPVLYIVNNLALPVLLDKSYGVFAGAQDALTQWWYGHNAVAFFLTTPILGIMYYFLPKAAERPVYSYRLSIVHFWSLVFLYIWAGPHHLLYTALPDWAQSLGMVFSLMLWAPSWGGMLNGLLTLRGAWHLLRTDPVLKFFAAGVTFYGMSTFEGPLLSIKSVNALAHYTDWIIAHVHAGALGWNGFMAAGLFYWLAPKLFGRPLWSKTLADWHFWLGTFGILLYVVAMWTSGVTQGLMARAETGDGGLVYPDWVEIVSAVLPMYAMRSIGGGIYLLGWVLMLLNLWKTVRGARLVEAGTEVAPQPPAAGPRTKDLVLSTPVLVSTAGIAIAIVFGVADVSLAVIALIALFAICVWGAFLLARGTAWHELLEGRPLAFSVLVLVAILVGGVVELVPGLVIQQRAPLAASYTPLELEGRDVYVREGCYVCHSQMIRPFRAELMRYGEPSRIEESLHDHPFQWGSKRTGPDLAREGNKRPDLWHYQHMLDPRVISAGSNMPAYPWLAELRIDPQRTVRKLHALKTLGVPYTDDDVAQCRERFVAQGQALAQGLQAAGGVSVAPDSELVALIAYLQRLGRSGEVKVGQAR
jgi:cytochrome c oxidase cbb3-type subunit I/II